MNVGHTWEFDVRRTVGLLNQSESGRIDMTRHISLYKCVLIGRMIDQSTDRIKQENKIGETVSNLSPSSKMRNFNVLS